KSTGPQTEPGKAASSRNRLSHGFCSKSLYVPGEKPEEFEALQADLTAEHQPANLTEQILVDQMAMSYWLRKRPPNPSRPPRKRRQKPTSSRKFHLNTKH